MNDFEMEFDTPDRGLRAWLAYSNLFSDIGEEIQRVASGGPRCQTEKFESAVIGFLLMHSSLGSFKFSDDGFRSKACEWRDMLHRSKMGVFMPTLQVLIHCFDPDEFNPRDTDPWSYWEDIADSLIHPNSGMRDWHRSLFPFYGVMIPCRTLSDWLSSTLRQYSLEGQESFLLAYSQGSLGEKDEVMSGWKDNHIQCDGEMKLAEKHRISSNPFLETYGKGFRAVAEALMNPRIQQVPAWWGKDSSRSSRELDNLPFIGTDHWRGLLYSSVPFEGVKGE